MISLLLLLYLGIISLENSPYKTSQIKLMNFNKLGLIILSYIFLNTSILFASLII